VECRDPYREPGLSSSPYIKVLMSRDSTMQQSLCPIVVLSLLLPACLASARAWGAIICIVPQGETLSARMSKSDVVLLLKRQGTVRQDGDRKDSTQFEVLRVFRSSARSLKPGSALTLPGTFDRNRGDRWLLFGTRSKNEAIDWDRPFAITNSGYEYLIHTPHHDAEPVQRLAYFLGFLEHADPAVAMDAYVELANVPFKELQRFATQMPRDQLRKFLKSGDVPLHRRGFYGLLLGLCGTAEDAELLESLIAENAETYHPGLPAAIAGYLLLKGEAGLALVEKSKLVDPAAPFSETYSALVALRYLWENAEGSIPRDRLQKSLRLLLDRTEFADLAIVNLARWQDWSVQQRLYDLYDTPGYDLPYVRRCIVQYMIASTKDVPEGDVKKHPPHAVAGAEFLQKLRERDPELVLKAERLNFEK
jgi:hypothetical protein